MNVQPWVNALNELTRPEGWIGSNDPQADRAGKVLNDMATGSAWIGHWFAADVDSTGKFSRPPAARIATSRRSLMLCLAVAHELLVRRGRLGDAGQSLKELVPEVAAGALATAQGLHPASADAAGGPYQEVDFAHGEMTPKFFHEAVSPRLAQIDALYETKLVDHVGGLYDRRSDESITRWGQGWTASAAVAILDWAMCSGCTTTRDLVRALWSEFRPSGQPLPFFRVAAGPLPTKESFIHIELRTFPALAQVIAGSEAFWGLSDRDAVKLRIPLRALDYVSSAGTVHYRGREVRHIYLAALISCLRAANDGE